MRLYVVPIFDEAVGEVAKNICSCSASAVWRDRKLWFLVTAKSHEAATKKASIGRAWVGKAMTHRAWAQRFLAKGDCSCHPQLAAYLHKYANNARTANEREDRRWI